MRIPWIFLLSDSDIVYVKDKICNVHNYHQGATKVEAHCEKNVPMIPRSVTSVNDFIDFMDLTTSFMLYYINGWRCTVGLPTKNAHWPPCGHPVRVPWCF